MGRAFGAFGEAQALDLMRETLETVSYDGEVVLCGLHRPQTLRQTLPGPRFRYGAVIRYTVSFQDNQ